MSLKAIHIVFITASILLGLFVGWWAWGQYTESKATADLVYAIAAGASVLGLIFEKINGYKDGSFFTPGFITMYMCRETLRRAVIQKFKEAGGKAFENIEHYEELKDKIDYSKTTALTGQCCVGGNKRKSGPINNSLSYPKLTAGVLMSW